MPILQLLGGSKGPLTLASVTTNANVNQSTFTVTFPADIRTGDLLIVYAAAPNGGASPDAGGSSLPGGGWTNRNSGVLNDLHLWTKTATGSEGGGVASLAWGASRTGPATVWCIRNGASFRGVDFARAGQTSYDLAVSTVIGDLLIMGVAGPDLPVSVTTALSTVDETGSAGSGAADWRYYSERAASTGTRSINVDTPSSSNNNTGFLVSVAP